jgi:hypothetical protein
METTHSALLFVIALRGEFYSTGEKRDGAFRKLGVRIKKPDYIARARTGHYAPK